MRSLRQNREQITAKAHETKDRIKDMAVDEFHGVQEAKERLRHQRPDRGGEWDYVDPSTWNVHQRLAAKTKGYATLANGISVLGAGLAAVGIYKYSRREYAQATVFMGIGRSLDLIDGVVAQKTGTCSDKGAAIDAGLDKTLAAAALVTTVRSGDMSVVEATAHGLQQAAIFRENVLIRNAGGEPNPSQAGKHGMAKLWLRLGGAVLTPVMHEAGYERGAATVERTSQAFGLSALYDNLQAIRGYNAERVALQQSQETA